MALGLFGGSLVVCLRDSAPETIVPVSPLHCKSSMVNSCGRRLVDVYNLFTIIMI